MKAKTIYKVLRKEKKLTVEEASTLLRISSSYLLAVENGSRKPGRDLLFRISKLYNKDISIFFVA